MANGGHVFIVATVKALLTVDMSIAAAQAVAALERIALRIMLTAALPHPFWHGLIYLSVYVVSFRDTRCRIIINVTWYECHVMGEQLMCQFLIT